MPDALGSYGLDFTRYWNSLHNEEADLAAQWPTDFGASGWSHSWRWNAVYDEQPAEMENNPPPHTSFTSITITFPDGHATKFKIARTTANGTFPRVGPLYVGEHETTLWPKAGLAVHDRVAEMIADGREFWLYRADGGAVRFVGVDPQYNTGHTWWHYQATEVYDRYGFLTTLSYYDNGPLKGRLKEVIQEGGRSLILTWGWLGGLSVITKVETGGPAAGQQVNYYYHRKPPAATGAHTLAQVKYQNEPVLGQTTSAYYVYDRAFGDDPNGPLSDFPVLKRADDPHFAGAMTKIRYAYKGEFCPVPFWPEDNPPEHFYSRFHFTGHAIAEERSGESGTTGTMVSRFYSTCAGGRSEENGIGGRRTFYFGDLAEDDEVDTIFGYQLTKLTDFGRGNESRPFRKQAGGSQPGIVWDGRDIDTHFQYLDESGSPTQAIYKDGSFCLYDRTNQTPPVVTPDPRIHNKQRHWLFSKRDENGNVTTYTRDSRRRVTHIAYYHGPAQGAPVASESYTYNDWNQVLTHTLPSSTEQHPAVVYYEYNDLHQLVWEHNSINEEQKKYEYDGLGRVEKIRDTKAIAENAPYTERMEYNGRHLVTKIHYRQTGPNPDPAVTYEYDKYGNRTATIDESGHRKDFTYDSYRRCTSSTEQVGPGAGCNDAQVRRWDWVYDREVDGVGLRPASSHTSSEWRVQVEPIVFNANGAGERRASTRTFDVNNRITSETTGLIQPASAPIGNWYSVAETERHYFTYDGNGQKERYTDPHNRVTTYGYNNRNRLETTTEPQRAGQPVPVTRFDYDAAGNKKMVTFPDTKTQEWLFFDPFGQPRQFKDERGNVTDFNYSWGPMKKLAEVVTHREKDGGGPHEDQHTQFFYDLMGRPHTTIFPDGSSEISTYQLGQLVEFKTRKGQKKIIDLYDARGREKHHYWRTFEGNVDGTTPAVSRVWDDANRLSSISNIFSTIAYTYDGAGQVRTESTTVAGEGVARTVGYCRYPSGDVSQITYPNGTGITRFYTSRGQLQGVGWGAGSTSYVYYPDGTVNYQARSNGVTTGYGYDGRGMISSMQHKRGENDLAKRDYWRDDRDRIWAWKRGTDQTYNLMENGRGNRYEYDWEGQLTQASYRAENPEGNATTPYRNDIFQYDKLGNRMGSNYVASRGWLEFTRDDNGLNQYREWSPSVINHDDDIPGWGAGGRANGVVMQEGWITGSYNALNQPVGVTTSAWNGSGNWMWFGYDPLGRCVKRWVGPHAGIPPNQLPPANTNPATYYYYDGWNLIQEGLSGGTPERVYVHGGRTDEIVASWAGGDWSQHQYDAQGNCILLTDTNGGIREQYDYDAFGYPYTYDSAGNSVPASAQWRNRFLFTGREWIKELRLYDYRARLYQPELGRFLQPDPKQFEAGDYNLYRYCHNDPVNRSDPMGLKDEEKDEKKLVREVFKLTRTPTGSNIPYTIRYTESGNWNNTKIADHYKDGMKGGLTKAEGTAKQSGLDWNIDLHVDWFVGSEDENSDVVTRELDHVQDLRNFSASFARSLSGNVSPAMFSQQVWNKMEESRNEYDGSIAQQISQGAALDKKHNLSMYPKQPAALPEFEDTASKVPYNPTSDPRY